MIGYVIQISRGLVCAGLSVVELDGGGVGGVWTKMRW